MSDVRIWNIKQEDFLLRIRWLIKGAFWGIFFGAIFGLLAWMGK